MRARYLLGSVVLGSAAIVAYGAMTAGTLSIAGNSVETDFIVKNDRTYVPLADVAKALKMNITKSATGFDLAPEGGANQVQGLTGKVGETLNGGWCTVKVVKVTKTDHYTKQFDSGTVDASSDKEEIVAVTMRIKNATQRTVTCNPFGFEETSLVDNDEHSYHQFTGLACDLRDRGPSLIKGSACDFALVFSVPKGSDLTEFIYSPEFMAENLPKKVFRISLKDAL